MWLEFLALPGAVVGLMLEVMSVKTILSGGEIVAQSFGKGMMLHALAMLAALPALRKIFPADYQQHPFTLFALMLGFGLPIPVIGPIFIVGFRAIIRRQPASFAEAKYVLGTRQYLTLPRDENIALESPKSVAEILNGHDNQARRAAVLALRVVEPRKALPLLQKAIGDSDEQVRLLSQTLYNQIIARLEAHVKVLEAELLKPPRHWNKLLLLAEQYHELVYLGLATDETETIYMDRAIELLEEAQKQTPENTTILFLLLKCLLRLEDVPRARKYLANLESRGWRSEITSPWSAEMYYLERNWTGLKHVLQQMNTSEGTAPVMRAPIEFWLHPANH